MAEAKHILYAKNLSDIYYYLKNNPSLTIISGCTQIKEFPETGLSVRNVEELNFIEKHERHFDIGCETTLSTILDFENSKVPSILIEAVKSIGNSAIRNIATLAGNLFAKDYKHTLYGPLLALDSKIEIKNETETLYLPMTKFNQLPQGYIATRVMIPLEEWEVSIFRRLGPSNFINDRSATFVFLANTSKGQLANLRIAFAGPFSLRSQELENKLLGAYLPLSQKSIQEMVEQAEKNFIEQKGEMEIPDILKEQFLNLLKYSLEQLT